MNIDINPDLEEKIVMEYRHVFDYCQTHTVPPYMLEISKQWLEEGLWKVYWQVVHGLPYDYNNKVVVDFGCKFGHLLPMFLSLGAKEAIGIDVEKSYVEPASALFQELYANIRIIQSEDGYIPIQPETVDFVLLNEVVSHINPAFLDIVYAEISRILKPEGKVLISDGNNIGYKPCLEALFPLWEAWENGPDGSKTDRDVVVKSFLTRRKEIIHSRYPDMDSESVAYLAQNTSGLWGAFLNKTIDDYVNSGKLTQRPYQRGVFPTNPGISGVVMERGFYAIQIICSLESYGLDAQDLHSALPQINKTQTMNTITELFREVFRIVKHYVEGKKNMNSLDLSSQYAYEATSPNLLVVGTKKPSE